MNEQLRATVDESMRGPEGYLLHDFKPGLHMQDITLTAAFKTAAKLHQGKQKAGIPFPEQELQQLREDFRVEPGH